MTPVQEAAFAEGGGGGLFSASNLSTMITLIGGTLIFIYVAWICISAYNEFSEGDINAAEMMGLWARALFALLITLYLFG